MADGPPLQSASPGKGCVLIGKIVKTHGIKGELKILPYGGSPENFRLYHRVFVVDRMSGAARSWDIRRTRSQGKLAIVQFAGVENREQAAGLVGSQLWLHEHDFPEPAAGEYYWFQFEGMRVMTEEGGELGIVSALVATKAHDILVVKGQGREYLIPVRDEFINKVDYRQRLVIIAPVPGLLELNT